MTLDGKIIEKSVTYDDLEKALDGLSLSRARKTALLTFAHKAEKLSLQNEKNAHKILEKVFLVIIQKSIELFEKKHLVTTEERQEIDQIISVLIK